MSERWQALQEMGQRGFKEFKEDLERALNSEEWFVRNAALVAAQASSNKKFALEWSEKLLFDKALVVRTQAIKNLIDMGSESSSELIFKALNHKDNFRGSYSLWIRPYLAQALALHPPKDWKKVFKSMLTDKDERVRSWAVVGLEKKSGLRLGGENVSLETKTKKWMNFFGDRQI
ncbi:MAG: hypothetical protein GW917_01530 [Bdellovibrionales bacterium]|nr:hypothetical protein [Bdellovibrionales bacterium]